LYDSSGSLDFSFGTAGILRVNIGSGTTDIAQDLAVDSNGHLAITGFSDDDLFVAKIE
ncbi:MAG: hypothetical protein GY896_08585, partial [Gammaproteobacteria bacterium]|nr:hypothetical protein [Gammaproteobacteria bacterium]